MSNKIKNILEGLENVDINEQENRSDLFQIAVESFEGFYGDIRSTGKVEENNRYYREEFIFETLISSNLLDVEARGWIIEDKEEEREPLSFKADIIMDGEKITDNEILSGVFLDNSSWDVRFHTSELR